MVATDSLSGSMFLVPTATLVSQRVGSPCRGRLRILQFTRPKYFRDGFKFLQTQVVSGRLRRPPRLGELVSAPRCILGRADADMTSSSCQLNYGHSCLVCLFELAVSTLIQIAQREPRLGGPHPTGAVLGYPAGSVTVSQWLLSYSPGLAS